MKEDNVWRGKLRCHSSEKDKYYVKLHKRRQTTLLQAVKDAACRRPHGHVSDFGERFFIELR